MPRDASKWMVGELRNEGDPVLVRHRLGLALRPNTPHDWLAIVTHHLTSVQSDGLPEADYNDSLQGLDSSIITALEGGRGDTVFLVETGHGKRHYYAYVSGYEAVGGRVHRLIEENPTHVLSYRSALDPERKFANRYVARARASA
jgi:hypothetical protein